MKIPPRIYLPLLFALAIGIAIGGLFLWQIHRSVSTIEGSFKATGSTSIFRKMLPGDKRARPDSAMLSQALMQLRQGEIFELKGEWKRAQDKYNESVNAGGGTPALKKLAAIQLQRREYDGASTTIDTLKQENRDSDDVLLLEGILALRKGDVSTAIQIFKKKPDSPQSMYGLALTAIVKGDHEGAKAHLTKASQSADPAIRGIAAVILEAYNEFGLFPNGQATHLATLLGRSLAQVNECETALALVTPVVSAEPRYRDAWIVKGFCEFTTERTKDALASLEQAYSLDPEKPEIQYFLARTHSALGDPQNAVTFLQYAILNGFEPQTDARELLADYAQELGNTDLALEQFKLIAQGKDGDLSAYRRYIELAIGAPNRGLDALALAKEALQKYPDDAVALTLAAKAALSAGLPDDATKYIESALKIDPKDKDAIATQEAIKKAAAGK